ncbi:SDR family oxidoreductase [Crocosphaera sp.]|uniref:SDR family oxidoreductase n=1 Tax=Crocosphaera sp. TaxID=2729996 RepID=UPI00262E104B|nr:SDR family oxidoreductase [Crocosphaera sp.]MDJ0582467.1 SDR family oxidoreductase [Crocosphaera sp.]
MGYDITNKVILVTGANRGIGKVVLESFIEHGAAKVYAAVRKIDTVKSLVDKYGEKVVPLMIDVMDSTSIYEAAKIAKDVNIVINNAGVLKAEEVLTEKIIDSLEFHMKTNVYGLITMAKAFAPILKMNGGGVFCQLNSIASMKGYADFAGYCASKAASYSITQSLKESLDKQGTRVLSIHPGPIATDMVDVINLTEIAEPPILVAEALLEALKGDAFHVFPDSVAKKVGEAYQSFSKNVIESDIL